jgi:hypothetical protein
MDLIYSRASSVAIWLGPEADGSELAVRLLERVASNLVSAQRIRFSRRYLDSAALLALFKRDYWKRLWVGNSNTCTLHKDSTDCLHEGCTRSTLG